MQMRAGERLAGWSEGNWNSSSFRCIAGYAAVGTRSEEAWGQSRLAVPSHCAAEHGGARNA